MMNWLQWFVCLCVSASSWARYNPYSTNPNHGIYNRPSSLSSNRLGRFRTSRSFYDDMFDDYNSKTYGNKYYSGSSLNPYRRKTSSYYDDDDNDKSYGGYRLYNPRSLTSRRTFRRTPLNRVSSRRCRSGNCRFSMSSRSNYGPFSTLRRRNFNPYRGMARAEYKPDDDGYYSFGYSGYSGVYKRPRAEYKPDDDNYFLKSSKKYGRPSAEYKPYKPDDDGEYSKSKLNYKKPSAEYKPYKPDDDGDYSKSKLNYKKPSAEYKPYKPDDDGDYSKSKLNYKKPSAEYKPYKPDYDGDYSKSKFNYKKPSAEYKPKMKGYYSKSYKSYTRPKAEYKTDDDKYFLKSYKNYGRPTAEYKAYKPDDDGDYSKSYLHYRRPSAEYKPYSTKYYSKRYGSYGRPSAEYKPDDDGDYSMSYMNYGRPSAEYKSIFSNIYNKKANPEYYRSSSEPYGQMKKYSDDDGYNMKAYSDSYGRKAKAEKYALYSSKYNDDYAKPEKYDVPYSEKSYDKKVKPETKYSSKSYNDDYSQPEKYGVPYSEKSYDKKVKPEISSYDKKTKPVYQVDDDGNVYLASSVSKKAGPYAEKYGKYPDTKKAVPEGSYSKKAQPKYVSDDDGSYSTVGTKDIYKDLLKYETKNRKYKPKPEAYTMSDDGDYLPVLPPKKNTTDYKKGVRGGRRGKVELLPYEKGHYQYLDTIKGYYEGRSSYDPVYDKTNNVIYVPMDDKTYNSYSKRNSKKEKKKVKPTKAPVYSDDDSDYLPLDKLKNPRSVQERIDALLNPSSVLDSLGTVQRGADPRILLDGGAIDLPARSRTKKPSIRPSALGNRASSRSTINVKYVTNQRGSSGLNQDFGLFNDDSSIIGMGMPSIPRIAQYPEIKRF